MSNNLIFKINPIIKIISTIIISFVIVLCGSLYISLILLCLLTIGCILIDINFIFYLKKILKMSYFLVFIFLFNLLFKIDIYDDLVIILKLIEFSFYASIVYDNTSVKSLNYGVEKLLKFLNIFKINYKLISLSITLSISFIPIIMKRTDKIIKSMKARGISLKNSSIKNKLTIIKSAIIPIIVTSFYNADKLSTSMELNLYDELNDRTEYYKYKIEFKDIAYFLVHILLFIFVLKEEIIF